MNAEEYLKGLNEHDPVFEIDTEYEFTEQQLINFAERYHERKLKILRLQNVMQCFGKDDLQHVYEDVDTGFKNFEDWFKEYTLPI